MTDKQLLKTAKSFRKGLLNGRAAANMCFAVSAPLEGYLSACGFYCSLLEVAILVDGDIHQHYVLKLSDGRILDATASQFNNPNGEPMPDIYLGERPSWYLAIKNTKYSEAPRKKRLPHKTSNL